MNTEEIKNKIDFALQNIVMPDEVKELLIELREEITENLSIEESINFYAKWIKLITTASKFFSEISDYL